MADVDAFVVTLASLWQPISNDGTQCLLWGAAEAQAPTLDTLVPPAGALSADPDVARWTPITMSWAVPTDHTAVVVARIGEDSALWMVAYDATLGGLAPLFRDKSEATLVPIATGYQLTVSLLPNGGWQRAQVTLIPYLAQEVT